MIKLLKEISLYTREEIRCGDGCCVWHEIGYLEEIKEGQEIDEYSYFCDELKENEDFICIN